MIIEFADPGYNWLFVWVALFILLIGIAGTVVLWQFIDDAAAPVLIIPILVMVFGPVTGVVEYGARVSDRLSLEITDLGYSNVSLSGDRERFTAATPDGEYFSGILVDVRPDSGYAYQVLEITDTPTLSEGD